MRLKVGDSVALKKPTIFGRFKRGEIGVVKEIFVGGLIEVIIEGVRVHCVREDIVRRKS